MLDSLQKLGLSEKEQEVFTIVLESGKITPFRISQLTGIRRTTVYAVADDLVRKGFLETDTSTSTIYYRTADPSDIKKAAKKERQALIEKELLLEELSKEMQRVPTSLSYAIPKIKFVEHEDRVRAFLFDRFSDWLTSMHGAGTIWGFQDPSFVAHEGYREWITWQWEHTPETADVKLLTNDSNAEKELASGKYPRRQMSYWKDADFSVSQWIFGDYSIMIQTKQKPHYLVELHDAVYADNMRKLFKNLWEEIK